MKPIHSFFPYINKLPKDIVIIFHQKPDGDAFGSALALAHFLKKFHHIVKVISPTSWANFLHWMPNRELIIDGEKYFEKSEKAIKEADWVFCLDLNTLSRTKKFESIIKASKAIKILIDHHEEPDLESFDYGINQPEKSSTCEMIYDLIINSGFKKLIDVDIACCIYSGIVTDTGSFKFNNCNGRVHEIVSQLKKIEFNHTLIHQNLFENVSENKLKFTGHMLLNRLIVKENVKTGIIYATKEDTDLYNIQSGETEGLVNYPLSIKGIEISAFIIDRSDIIRLSFRSNKNFNVNEFARKYFNGGGHIMAAGGGSHLTLEETITSFWEAIDKEIIKLC